MERKQLIQNENYTDWYMTRLMNSSPKWQNCFIDQVWYKAAFKIEHLIYIPGNHYTTRFIFQYALTKN